MNDDLHPDEQHAFSEAYDLIERLIRAGGNPEFVGRGVLVAAVSCLRKSLSHDQIAEVMYQFADDYAVRNLPET